MIRIREPEAKMHEQDLLSDFRIYFGVSV